jgi:hypothetical protein
VQVQYGFAGNCVGSTPYRFLIVTRCRENLSSGEKRAAKHQAIRQPPREKHFARQKHTRMCRFCDLSIVCDFLHSLQQTHRVHDNAGEKYLESVDSIPLFVDRVHEMHGDLWRAIGPKLIRLHARQNFLELNARDTSDSVAQDSGYHSARASKCMFTFTLHRNR